MRFRSFNHSTCKTVLNLLEPVQLRLVVERVTVVKFRVDNRGSDGTGCFRIKVRTDTAELVQSAGMPYCRADNGSTDHRIMGQMGQQI